MVAVVVGSELLVVELVVGFDFGFDFVAAGFDPAGVDAPLPIEEIISISDPSLI